MKTSIQDKFKQHVNNKCTKCKRKNCNGIRVNTNGDTVCEVTEYER